MYVCLFVMMMTPGRCISAVTVGMAHFKSPGRARVCHNASFKSPGCTRVCRNDDDDDDDDDARAMSKRSN